MSQNFTTATVTTTIGEFSSITVSIPTMDTNSAVGEVSICLLQILLDMEKLMSEEEMGQEQQEEEVLEAELVSIVGIDTVMEEKVCVVSSLHIF
jgi:hypothetical protein